MNEKQIKITLYSLILGFDLYITLGIPVGFIILDQFRPLFSPNDYVLYVAPILGIFSFISLITLYFLEHRKKIELNYYERFVLGFITAINLSLYATSFFFIFQFVTDGFKF